MRSFANRLKWRPKGVIYINAGLTQAAGITWIYSSLGCLLHSQWVASSDAG